MEEKKTYSLSEKHVFFGVGPPVPALNWQLSEPPLFVATFKLLRICFAVL